MTRQPELETIVQMAPRARELFRRRNPSSVLDGYQLPERKGINKSGEFAVVRKLYDALSYESWLSGQAKLGDSTYLLTRMPDKRRQGDAAYRRIVDFLGEAAFTRFERVVSEARSRRSHKTVGGDPDLFVFNRRDRSLRFFVEVKLEDQTRKPPYRDTLGDNQELLFPLIARYLKCEVRIARVQIVGRGYDRPHSGRTRWVRWRNAA